MAITVTCPCGKQLKAMEELAGKRAKCPSCGRVLKIPEIKSPRQDSDDPMDQAFNILNTEESAPTPPSPPVPTVPTDFSSAKTSENLFGFQGNESPKETPATRPSSQVSRRKPVTVAVPSKPLSSAPSLRNYLYLVLLFTLIPLVISTIHADQDDTKERFEKSIQKIAPEKMKRLDASENVSMDDLFEALPEDRIEGALLPRKTWGHWLYALISGGVFFTLILFLFPLGTANPRDLLLVGIFTATLGILFLLAVQYAAMFTRGSIVYGRSVLVIIFWILKFIGFSYDSALRPDSNFVLSFFGFTFGVGLCEEVCKAIPLLYHYRRSGGMGWQAALLWGLASGAGFGISEGITYSSDYYNGIHTGDIYVVRFVSCVALHAIWTASVAITIYKNQGLLQGEVEWGPWALALVRMVAIPMILHGLYDTLLKMEITAAALLVALVSFCWLAFQIESTRRQEGENLETASA
jgi:RsiW-degrading membrane proteinase PrsW (M82 family)